MSEADDKFASDAVKRKLNMKKFLMTLALGGFALGASAQYQVQNSNFEQWGNVEYGDIKGEEPLHWNSFITGTGGLKSTACQKSQLFKSEEVRPGSTGKYSAKLVDKWVMGKIYAQGNMTTGCINMGNMIASQCGNEKNKGNCNYTDTKNPDFNQSFSGLPDAMHVWVKYVSTKKEFRAKAVAVLHSAGYYQDPNKGDCTAKMIGEARNEDVASNNDWQELTIPFVYSSKDTPRPAYALISFATNSKPGKGTGSDYLLVDDLEFVYYHALSELKYGGTRVEGFSESTFYYDLSTEMYDESKLSYTIKGFAAEAEKVYDPASAILTITVKGDDYNATSNNSSMTVYTIQFSKQADEVDNYTNGLTVSINGKCNTLQQTTYSVVTKPSGEKSLVLKNFMLNDGGYITPVGNIVLNNVTVQGNHYTTEQKIFIEEGDDESVDYWLGPDLDEVPVKLDGTLHDGRLDATIDIDMSATLGQVIKVILAPLYEATPAKALTIPADGLGNVTFNRTFYKGWNTFVAPFPVTKKQLGYEKANTLASISTSASWLKFEDVADETLEANKPYLLYYSADQTPVEFYYGGAVLSTTGDVKATATAHDGAKVSMVGNYTPKFSVEGNYLLTDRSGYDEIAKAGARSVVDATKCYFTFENVPNPAALSVKFGGDVTGMGNVVAEETAPRANGVYNLQGVKLSNGSVEGLPAGLYIVNGRKVLVK